MGQLTIRANGQTLVLAGATNPAGTTVGVWSDAGLSSSVTLPATLSTDTTYFLRDGETLVTIQQPDGSAVYSAPVSIGAWPREIIPLPTVAQTSADIARAGTGASAVRATNQSIPNSANTAISFSGVTYDDYGMWAVGNPTRLTIPAALTGKRILIVGQLDWTANVTGTRGAALIKNGTTRIAEAAFGTTTSSHVPLTPVALDVPVTSDYYEIQAFQASGGALNVDATTYFNPSLSIIVLR